MSTELQRALELLRKARNQVIGDSAEQIDEFIENMEQPIARVRQDTDPMNPRVDFDNVGVMFCKHRRYTLGDKGAEDPFEEVEIYDLGGYEIEGNRLGEVMESLGALCDDKFIDDEDYDKAEGAYHEIENMLRAQDCVRVENRLRPDIAICLPLYLYDHSGITISHGSFHDQWDSGQVGWHYATKEAIDREWDGDLDKAKKCLEAELQTYDHYLRGDVWGYTIETREGEYVDACWGFYGDELEEIGMLEHVQEKYRPLLEEAWENRSYE